MYVSCLTLVPCSVLEQIRTHEHEHVEDETTHNQNHSDDCNDNGCTPFCSCTSHHISFIASSNFDFNTQKLQLIEQSNFDFYSDLETTTYHKVLFHPPIA